MKDTYIQTIHFTSDLQKRCQGSVKHPKHTKKFFIYYVKSKYWLVCSPQLHSCPQCAEAVQRERERAVERM